MKYIPKQKEIEAFELTEELAQGRKDCPHWFEKLLASSVIHIHEGYDRKGLVVGDLFASVNYLMGLAGEEEEIYVGNFIVKDADEEKKVYKVSSRYFKKHYKVKR